MYTSCFHNTVFSFCYRLHSSCLHHAGVLISVWTCGFNLFLKCVIKQELIREYAFSEFATSSCKWGKVVCLQNVVLWCEVLLAIWYHIFVCFSLLDFWFIIKTKVSLETRFWKDISHQTLQSNSYGKIYGFDCEDQNEISLDKLLFRLTFLILLINETSSDESNINIRHQEPHFIPN